jgi:hypothetical protein
LGTGKGKAYLYNDMGLIALTAGGLWANGVFAGARAVDAAYPPWGVSPTVGVRLACDAA